MFTVFGRSKVKAEERAAKKLGISVDCLDWQKESLAQKTKEIFEKMRPTKISRVYSNYSEAEQYLALVRKGNTAEDCVIKIGSRDIDDINPKTGRQYPIQWN